MRRVSLRMLGNIYIVKQADSSQTVAIASDFLNGPTVNVDEEDDEDTALFCKSEIKHQKKITSKTVKTCFLLDSTPLVVLVLPVSPSLLFNKL